MLAPCRGRPPLEYGRSTPLPKQVRPGSSAFPGGHCVGKRLCGGGGCFGGASSRMWSFLKLLQLWALSVAGGGGGLPCSIKIRESAVRSGDFLRWGCSSRKGQRTTRMVVMAFLRSPPSPPGAGAVCPEEPSFPEVLLALSKSGDAGSRRSC